MDYLFIWFIDTSSSSLHSSLEAKTLTIHPPFPINHAAKFDITAALKC